MSEEKYLLQTCNHCGNKGLMEIKGSSNKIYEDYDDMGNPIGLSEEQTWYLLSCPVCHMATLCERETQSWDPSIDSITLLYPENLVDTLNVPSDIKGAFDSAMRTKGIDSAICLLSLRRTLEMICKKEGATGGSLEDKIKTLVSDKKLPPMLDDICYITRKAGNDGAHGDQIKLSSSDTEQVIRYVATIINYLYSMPKRIEILKNTIDKK